MCKDGSASERQYLWGYSSGGEQGQIVVWRTEWDSNPRESCPSAGFQDRCLKPLGHPSGADKSITCGAVSMNKCERRLRRTAGAPRKTGLVRFSRNQTAISSERCLWSDLCRHAQETLPPAS